MSRAKKICDAAVKAAMMLVLLAFLLGQLLVGLGFLYACSLGVMLVWERWRGEQVADPARELTILSSADLDAYPKFSRDEIALMRSNVREVAAENGWSTDHMLRLGRMWHYATPAERAEAMDRYGQELGVYELMSIWFYELEEGQYAPGKESER